MVRLALLLSIASSLAACGSEPVSDDIVGPFTGPTTRFVVDRFTLPATGEQSRLLYRTVDDRGSIGDFSVSPNDQYVAVEVVPDVGTSVTDGRAVDPQSSDVTTVFVDIASGAIVKSVAGFSVQW